MAIKTMYITNEPQVAKIAENNTVDRIWVDLEIKNKLERQGGMYTVISFHKIDDVSRIKSVLNKAELMVRVNPLNEESPEEINEVIARGADIVMLPMYQTPEEAKRFLDLVNGRAQTILLLETIAAEKCLDKVLEIGGMDEIYIGMNDLHIQYHMKFMFELLADGKIEDMGKRIKAAGVNFGFGGLAQLDQGQLPARYILAEHYRLGASSTILSRSFVHHHILNDPKMAEAEFKDGMNMIREYEKWLCKQSPEFFLENKRRVIREVEKLRNNGVKGGM